MAIERIKVALVRCDWCGVPGPHSPSSAAACAEARAVGWESVHNVHACPVCVKRGAAAETPPEMVSAPIPALTRFTVSDAPPEMVAVKLPNVGEVRLTKELIDDATISADAMRDYLTRDGA